MSFALEKKVFFSVGTLLLLSILMYTFLVMQSIAYVIQREEVVFNIHTLNEKVSHLEKEYLQKSQLVTEKRAGEFGLYASSQKTFIERGAYTLGTISR